ncbi:MAG TPA: 4-(cytidine 5'-diphospho)-2-C-methyl-D-erythritol kinase [Candidatus Omnitrophota bacterium]|nr:4-(cytidine 5'-diphospho)-2-C-methyl-D-erythritol kinase [Candidatus Omnitrophota bacterium]
MNSITLSAPAKVNIFLKVLDKRKDGYHNLYTLFERINLADTITISKIPSGIEVRSDKFITKDSRSNIAYKAAESILKAGRVKGGVRIDIKKRIPIAAGLGGGSSDAATVLIGINRLYHLGISKNRLLRLGAKLGADVAFFLLEKPFAIGRGKGDTLNIINSKVRLYHILVNPGFGIATKGVYDAYDKRGSLGLTSKNRGVKIPSPLRKISRFEHFETMIYNDLEPVVVKQKKIIGSLIKRLAVSSGHNSILSGSGPSVFCLCRTRKEAMLSKRRFLAGLPGCFSKRLKVFLAETMD